MFIYKMKQIVYFQKELQNYTWREIVQKVIEAQKEQNMCIHKRDLTELDIYQRILRLTKIDC